MTAPRWERLRGAGRPDHAAHAAEESSGGREQPCRQSGVSSLAPSVAPSLFSNW